MGFGGVGRAAWGGGAALLPICCHLPQVLAFADPLDAASLGCRGWELLA